MNDSRFAALSIRCMGCLSQPMTIPEMPALHEHKKDMTILNTDWGRDMNRGAANLIHLLRRCFFEQFYLLY